MRYIDNRNDTTVGLEKGSRKHRVFIFGILSALEGAIRLQKEREDIAQDGVRIE